MKKIITIILIIAVIFGIFGVTMLRDNKDELAEIIPHEFGEPTYFTGVKVPKPIYFNLTPDDSMPFGSNIDSKPQPTPEQSTQTETTLPATLNATPDNKELYSFKDTLFIGDSITLGIEQYAKDTNNTALLEGTYFANAGFAIYHNRQTVNDNSMHPKLNGEKMKISKAIRTSKKNDLFISLGTNDLVTNSPSKAKSDFVNVILAILGENPKMKIHIIETVRPTNKGKEKLTVESVTEYNKLIKEYADSKNFEYITWPEEMFNEDGSLKDKYCSDGLTHLTQDAYKLMLEKIIYKK